MKRTTLDSTFRVDERNAAALGIFSMLSRDTSGRQQWHSQFTVAGRTYDVTGDAALGRPHGNDVNVIIGLENLFLAQGCPADNVIHTSAVELRDACLLPLSGRSLQRLREGLDRIWETTITVTQGWHLPSGKTLKHTEKMRLISHLRSWSVHGRPDLSDDPDAELVPHATMSITLGAPLADSIRQGYTNGLQLKILRDIKQPPARTLYRLLEAHRYDAKGRQRHELTVDLDDWTRACGLKPDSPSRQLRFYAKPHEELTRHQYLRDVNITTSGGAITLRYEFINPEAGDPALVRILIEAGVSASAANQLARQYPDRIEQGVRLAQDIRKQRSVSNPIRSPGGFTRTVIEKIEDYLPAEPTAPAPAASRAQQAAEERAREEDAREEQRRAELEAADPQTQWKTNAPALRFYLKSSLTAAQWTTLEGDCLSGQRSSLELLNALVAAQANLTLQSVIHDLKEDLG